jgi:2-alkyl-3-oxoalkanoate reductase
VRGSNPERRLAEAGVEARLHAGALEDAGQVRAAVQGAEVVVHLAAVVDPLGQRDSSKVWRVNHDLGIGLARVSRDAGVRRFVFMSSIAAMGFWSGVATAESECRPTTAYGRAKRSAERALVALQSPGFDVIVLRPPTVYGPGEPYNFLAWVRSIHRGAFRVVGGGENAFPLVTTQNLARTTRAAVEGRIAPGTFLVSDREPYSINRIHKAIARALGRAPARRHVPVSVAWAAGLVNEAAVRILPQTPLVLSRARVRTLTVDQRFSIEPLLQAGVELDAPLEEWVERTIRDYERRGVLG